MTKTHIRAGMAQTSLCSLIALIAAGPAALAQEVALDLGTVVVSGERTDRPLRDTYVAVSVLSSEDLETAQQQNLNEVLLRTPNVFVESPNNTPSIRGLQGGGPGGAVSTTITGAPPRLAFITDGVTRPASIANSSGVSLWDVEQIEVFRGPQSLLRGRSAIAGAIVVETRDPTFDTEGAFQFGIKVNDVNDPSFVLNSVISGGITDNIAGRLSLELADGTDPRTSAGFGAGSYVTDYDNIRLRGKLLGTFDTGLGGLDLIFTAERQQGQTPQTRATVSTPAPFQTPTNRVLLNPGTNARTFDTETTLFSLEAVLDTGAGELSFITSYIDDRYESVSEQVFPSPLDVQEKIFSQDILYAFGKTDRAFRGEFGGVFGFNYERREQDNSVVTPLPTPPFPPASFLNFSSDVVTETTSVYADMRYGLTDQLTIFGGARLLHFKDDRKQFRTPPFPLPPSTQTSSQSETEFLPTLGLAYYFNEQSVLSGSVRRGYNPGGGASNLFTGMPYTFESESVTTAEVTYRSTALQGSATYGITAFYNWHDNPQLFAELVPGNRATLQVINQPEAISYGLEFDGTWQASDRLFFDASLGLLGTEITEAQLSNLALKGNSLGQDPAITLSVGTVYQLSDFWSLDGRVTYRGESENDFNNVPGAEVGDYWLVDVGATGDFENDLSVRVAVTNLFDELGVNRFIGSFADVTPPRTVSLTATKRF